MKENNTRSVEETFERTKKGRFSILAVITVLLLGILIAGCSKKKKLDLMDYATVEFSGINSKGTACTSVDWSAFENAVATEITDLEEQFKAVLAFESTIEYSLDKTTGLTNGDTITLSVSWDEEVAEKYGFSFNGKDRIFTVENLKEAVEIDMFADVYVEFDGVSPALSVKIRNTSEDPFLQTVYYTAEPAVNVAEGDSITVKATYIKSAAEEYGYIPISDTKTYIVENVDKYISSFDQIPDDVLSQMDQQARDVIESKLADGWNCEYYLHPDGWDATVSFNHDSVKIDSIQLKEYQFFKIKDGVSVWWGDAFNSVFLIYEIKATDNIAPDGFVVYLPVYYSDIILTDTGAINIILTDAYITDAMSNSYDSLYRDTVSYNKAEYDYKIIEPNKN